MKIKWEKTPQIEEEIVVAKYIEGKISILKKLFDLYVQENLFTISFTSPPLNGDFYTYEVKYHQHDKNYLINVWKGVRTGDTLPVLYGYLII
ncbi:MAG: hypothetical protein HVN34_12185 [Methanobacteriaceae archaeon]|jgi:hypothetical protein|nr:hypothetical protein [Methanobacteriaceae archaeon]